MTEQTDDDDANLDAPEDVVLPDIAQPLWFSELAPGGTGEGFFEKTSRHSLMYVKRARPVLFVSFDNLSNVNDNSTDRVPWAYKFARDLSVSHLGVMAHGKMWYRDADLIARMEKLRDDGFFDPFERVVFAGSSMGAFAALVFASLVPGAHVLAFNPQSTLDPDIVPWEDRYWIGQRQDWSLPLSDAKETVKAAGTVSVFYDPYFAPDRQHFERLAGPNVTGYKCWFSNHKSAVFLRKIDALKPVMIAGVLGELTPDLFYALYRRRRELRWYAGALSAYFADSDRPEIAARTMTTFRQLKRTRLAAEAAVVPDHTYTIVTTMKNEGPFMLEWIAYHRSIGFTDFTIFTNDCDDGTDKIAERLDALGLASHVANQLKPGQSPQRKALRRSQWHDKTQEADWLMCADVDEFLMIRTGGGHLKDLMAKVGDVDAISFCWKLFGHGQVENYHPGFVTEQFLWAAPENTFPHYRASGLKTLTRNNDKFKRIKIHRPLVKPDAKDVRWVDAGGQTMPVEYLKSGWSAHGNFSHEYARLHHYAVRSIDSFLVKRDRGRTNHINADQGIDYWQSMNTNHVYDDSILARLPAAREEYDKLIADPELAALHVAACDWHIAKITELKARDGWPAFRDQIAQIDNGAAWREKQADG